MKIRMYECGFGDCFRLRNDTQDDLYVDFGIHSSSLPLAERSRRFDQIIAEMQENKDFLLSHYHDDHYNGAIYMANHSSHRFRDVYISDVWNMPESVHITSLTLLRGIFTRSVMKGGATIIDFLSSICTSRSRIHFVSRGTSFCKDQFVALWPEKEYVAEKAEQLFAEMEKELGDTFIKSIVELAKDLNSMVMTLSTEAGIVNTANINQQFASLQEKYITVLKDFDSNFIDQKNRQIQYKLSKFGNEISIVFQNNNNGRNVLFTGDFGKEANWSIIERNCDRLVPMHPYYEVIKVPHHGTRPYYHSFIKRIKSGAVLLIPNGYVRKKWGVFSQYRDDSHKVNNKTVCAQKTTCTSTICPRCTSIHPNYYIDV